MRWMAVGVAGLVLGCPTQDERGEYRLDMNECTRTSRFVAWINCDDDEFFCKKKVLWPENCGYVHEPAKTAEVDRWAEDLLHGQSK